MKLLSVSELERTDRGMDRRASASRMARKNIRCLALVKIQAVKK